MKVQILYRCLVFILIFSYSFLKVQAQENANNDGYAHIFIFYPITKSGNAFSIFLNRKSIGKLTNGARIECRLLREGPIAITLIEGNKYLEPLTQANNSRTISVKKERSYYFRANGNGSLEYILSTQKGEKNYADAKEYISQPASFIEAPDTNIPLLDTVSK